MATQSDNILDVDKYERTRQELAGTLKSVGESVKETIDDATGPVRETYFEVFTEAPIAKALAIGYMMGALSTLLTFIIAR